MGDCTKPTDTKDAYVMNKDCLQAFCYLMPHRWYEERIAIVKEDSDQGQNLNNASWNAFAEGRVSAFSSLSERLTSISI